ncbi:MAG TPA: sulfite exporter TauE/SafE family protein [Terriglobales bacterium]|nr:sulfite exporter TauE/SafE family protein [Terriglobales bacterium]
MGGLSVFGEALALGLASGPACIASCWQVLVPSMLAEHSGTRVTTRYLAIFLGTRLAGYLIFAAAAWEARSLVTLSAPTRVVLFALIHMVLACVLLRYACVVGRTCTHAAARAQLVTIGSPQGHIPGAAVLGFLTGISLCPPFVAAGVRAAETANLAAAVLFFLVFFVGTTVWFLPFAGMGWIKRNEAVTTVARMAMVLIALYYLVIGFSTVIGIRYGY